MKIGILTLPPDLNYGGILQAWALKTVLNRMGHDVEVFKPEPLKGRPAYQMPLVWGFRLVNKLLRHSTTPIFAEKHSRIESKRRFGAIRKFITDNLPLRIIPQITNLPYSDYDGIVVGSDQIWRKIYIEELWRTKTLSNVFLKQVPSSIRKIAYAASFGVDKWQFNPETTSDISVALNDFKAVSVREKSAVNLLKDNAEIDVEFVLDPTMLLEAKDYLHELNLSISDKPSGVVSYILDANSATEDLINQLTTSTGLTHTELNNTNPSEAKRSIEEWLSGIASASIVVTDSFHGCVFSIIFRKPLLFLGNEHRGNTRFDSLISTFGLHPNLINRENPYDPSKSYSLPADIDEKLQILRNSSTSFLLKSLQ